MKDINQIDFKQACLLLIEEKLDWGPSIEWHSEVFVELSERIQSETNVMLSPTTLKRVWGKVKYDSEPSISTLNALAVFAGHSNWRAFKSQAPASLPANKTNSAKNPLIYRSIGMVTLLLLIIVSILGLNRKTDSIDLTSIIFDSKPITKGYPNTVVFDLDIHHIKSDDILIQQDWDPTKTIPLSKNQKQATGIYYYPGHFRAKLVVDGQIIKEHDLFLKSEGWLGTIDYTPIPSYHSLNKHKIHDSLSLPDAMQQQVIKSEKPVRSTFHFVKELGLSPEENFSLETTIKSTFDDKWAVCQTLNIVLLGTKGAIVLPFSQLGCVSDLNLMLNAPSISGKKNDLSAFGVNLSTFKRIKIEVVHQNISVSISNEEIFSSSFTKPFGELVGIRFKFLGLGEVKGTQITSLDEGY